MRTHRPGQSALLILDVARILKLQNIPYVVVGALAAAVHGDIRGTTDADALLSVALPQLQSLRRLFEDEGLQTELRFGDGDDPIPAMLILRDSHQNTVELLAGLRGLDPAAFTRKITVPFQGELLEMIGREDFIAMKCYAGGPQDIADAHDALRRGDIATDLDLLRRLTRRFGRAAADVLEQLLANPRATSTQNA
jgi:predicted nucleotidyltransferase